MPKIPQAESQSNINVGSTPRINTPEMGMGAVNASERSQKGVVNSIENAEDTLIKVRDFRQQTEANNLTFERLSEIKSRADQDIDFDSTKYETEIDKLGQEAAKTISGQLAKDEFMAGFQKQAIAAKWGIKNEFRARELKSIDASIDYQAQQIIDSYGGMNDAEKMTSVANYRKSLENGVSVGIYNKATADAKYAKFQKDVVEGKVEYDILDNPDYALGELQKGKEGEYATLPDNKRVDFIKQAETRIEKIKNQQEEAIAIAVNQREADLIDLKINGTLTEPQVKKERDQGNISAKFADAMIGALRNPRVDKKVAAQEKKNNTAFNKIALDMVDITKKPGDIRNELLRKNAVGELTDNDFQVLYTFNQAITKEAIDKAMPKKTWLQRLFNNSKDKGIRQEIIADMFKQYMQRIAQGDDPGKAVSEITSTYLDQHLADEAKKPDRSYAINPQNKQRIYSEDGGATWHNEKTGELVK